jgi:Ca2+-binding RTX toxin-like protein
MLIGGAGAGRFEFPTPLMGANGDAVPELQAGRRGSRVQGTFNFVGDRLDASEFTIDAAGTGPGRRSIYDQATGRLFCDPDGSGATRTRCSLAFRPGPHATPVSSI